MSSANTPDSSGNATPTSANAPDSHRWRWVLAAVTGTLLLAVVLAVVFRGGRDDTKTDQGGDDPKAGPKGDPWKTAGTRLRKEADLAATKQVLATLTSEFSAREGEKLPAFTNESLAAVGAVVPLSQEDSEELSGAGFSAHDPVYLADCLYLRDAARSLGLAGLSPEKQAELAFAWVCRQVYLQPWPRNVGTHYEPTVLPPTAVLQRGFGSGIERMYVFLALLQQLELDGCLIGGPDAPKTQSRQGPLLSYPFIKQLRVPRGPFWAVGVRVGNDVRLFDPWRGAPFPVTLNQLKAKPDAAKAWFEDKANISAATVEDAKNATAYLAVPVNSLSPRMALFESKLKGELGAKFAFDLKALEAMRAAYPDPKPTFWNPPDDPFAYGRASRSFLPLEMGGADRNPQSAMRLYESYLRGQIPTSAFTLQYELPAAAQDRIRAFAVESLVVAFIQPPNPRERIQRGQFQDAAIDVVAKQETFANGLERLRTEDAGAQKREIQKWCEEAVSLHEDLTRAETILKSPDAVAEAQAKIDAHWKQRTPRLIVDTLSAEVGRAEAAFLFALCKHEQAERLQIRLDRATETDAKALRGDALDAWKAALSAWRTYDQFSSAHAGFPGRAAHANSLRTRAAQFVQGDAKK